VRPAWSRGRNYDASKLGFFTAIKAFTIGESLIGGPDLLGSDGPDVELDGTFTFCSISETTTVEDGLFVHRETPVCNVAATLPSVIALEGKRLAVKYGGVEVFRGTLREPEWSEQVDVRGDRMPGNTAVKTYRVRMSATNGEEQVANAQTPPRNFTVATDLLDRIESWTGLPGVLETNPDAAEFPLNIANLGQDDVGIYASWWKYVTINDTGVPSLGQTLRDALRLYNMSYRITPGLITLQSNNRWLAKVGADPLEFTDETVTVDPLAGDDYQGEGHLVSYAARTWGVDAGLWTDAARLTFSNAGEDFVAGPWRAGSTLSSDTEIALGPTEWQEPFQAQRTTRLIISTLPLKSRPRATTKSLSTPLQSVAQLEGNLPGMARVTADGVTENVAVLGRTHTITPDRWLVEYETGPHHLLDRQSDHDPGMFRNGSITNHPSLPDTVVVTFTQPPLTDYRPNLRVWYVDTAMWPGMDVGMISTEIEGQHQITNNAASYPWVEGVSYSQNMPNIDFPLGVPVKVFAQYTTNDDGNSASDDPKIREGMPAYLGTYTRT
jgi:hypothetical protein